MKPVWITVATWIVKMEEFALVIINATAHPLMMVNIVKSRSQILARTTIVETMATVLRPVITRNTIVRAFPDTAESFVK